MLLNLYGDDGLVFQTLATGFKEAHLQDKLKFDVVEAKKVGQKFSDYVKKLYNAKFLDDAEMVIRFAEIKQSEPEEQPEQAAAEEQPSEEKPAEEPEAQGQPAEEKPAEDDEKKEETTNEAEEPASNLKKKIADTVKRCLFVEGDVEVSDLEGYLEGYNVYFLKISFKGEDEPEA